jgi:hypothetical protein
MVYGVKRHFHQYFSYIVTVSFMNSTRNAKRTIWDIKLKKRLENHIAKTTLGESKPEGLTKRNGYGYLCLRKAKKKKSVQA